MPDKKSYYVTVNDEGKVGSASDIRPSEDVEVLLSIPGQNAKNFSADGIHQWKALGLAAEYIEAGANESERAERAKLVQVDTGKRPYGPGDLVNRNIVLIELDEMELADLKAGNTTIDLDSVPDLKWPKAKVRDGKAKIKKA